MDERLSSLPNALADGAGAEAKAGAAGADEDTKKVVVWGAR